MDYNNGNEPFQGGNGNNPNQGYYGFNNNINAYNPAYDQWMMTKKRKKKSLIIVGSLIIVAVISLMVFFSLFLGKGWASNRIFGNERVQINIPVQHKPQLDSQYYDEKTGKYTTEGVAKKVMPSVVSIEIYQKGVTFTPTSQGSGIILTENGYIITNAHVVENATGRIKIVLNDGKGYEAQVVGSDKKTDLAVLKIDAKGLTAADFGDSDELQIGEQIVAIGSPAGLYGSLTRGVVSGLDRMIKTEKNNTEMNCIQIDAAINPGNSGGALVNMYGQVVGINSSKFVSEVYDGIGFSISINAARPIIEQLIASGYIKDRVRIGITFYEVNQDTAKTNKTKPGLYVNEIDSSCDIAKTELKSNDVITHIEGTPVTNRSDVEKVMKGKKPGDEVTAKVYRQDGTESGKTFDIKFKLMEDNSQKIDTSDTSKTSDASKDK